MGGVGGKRWRGGGVGGGGKRRISEKGIMRGKHARHPVVRRDGCRGERVHASFK